MRTQYLLIFWLLLATSVGIAFGSASSAKDIVCTFGDTRMPDQVDSHISTQIDPNQAQFFVELPANYDDNAPFGVVVYDSPADDIKAVPIGWGRVLSKKKLLFIAPQNAGNDQNTDRRLGLELLAARGMEQHYKIDPARVYAAGYSGGARTAGRLGFYAGDVFHGTIQSCGADFYTPVKQVEATPQAADNGTPYGVMDATADEINAAKKNVHFTLITGSQDFRVGNIHDIYHGGYEPEHFMAKLIDVPGMSHVDCSPRTLALALDFIEGTHDAPATQPAPPDWMAKDYAQWPQLWLTNDIHLSDGTWIRGASGFLMRLPNDVVVGATAKHLLNGATLADLKNKWRSWALFQKDSGDNRVTMAQLAEKLPDAEALDWLVMVPSSQGGPWPSQPVPARVDPLDIGDTVYVISVPDGDSARQRVYKGTVIDVQDNGEFIYTVDEQFNSHGFSGAPIIDSSGLLAGVHIGHMDKQGEYAGLETASVLDMIQVPDQAMRAARLVNSNAAKTEASAPASSAGNNSSATNSSASTATSNSTESDEDHALRVARLLIDNKAYDKAREKLQSIIDGYPGTSAAEQARKLLSGIQDQ